MVEAQSLPRIHKLSETVSNQIAAGEVIERPASVIKELIENSLDAGASNITIHVEQGGTRLIRVEDDGHGVHPDDMQLALTSHATSKLSRLDDLLHIISLGFRGEALPSIASVSRFKMVSRINQSEQGWSVLVDPSDGRLEMTPAAHPVGTTVEVANLFFKTPARRKFLRSDKTEYLHILETLRRLALSCFTSNIRMLHNGKQVFVSGACQEQAQKRVAYIMGQEFMRNVLALDYQDNDMRLWGWLGTAEVSRNQTDRQYFFLNNRCIRDRQVNHAIRMAFAEDIYPGRHPVYVLYLEMDIALSDVNVHPTKNEVRFRHARNVHDFIYSSVHSALNDPHAGFAGVADEKEQYDSANQESEDRGWSQKNSSRPHYQKEQDDDPSASSTLGQLLTCIEGNYLILRQGAGLILVDILAARKYLLRKRFQSAIPESPVISRPLLVPVKFTFSESEASLILKHGDVLLKYGLSLDLISTQAVMVRTIPVILEDVDIKTLLQDLLAVFSQSVKSDDETVIGVFENNIPSLAENGMTSAEYQGLLQSLENSGLDMTKPTHAGLWRRFSMAELGTLIEHGK